MTPDRVPMQRNTVIARVLLLVLAFFAQVLAGPANVALALLVLLFLAEVPGHWGRLRREPALWLLVGAAALTTLLAVRAAWLFPATAEEQWNAISAWVAPFLFIVPAWWIARDPRQVWPLLAASALGLAVGVVYKADWAMLPLVLEGERYHFGFAALGLAFLASVTLLGLLVFRVRITHLGLLGRPRPLLGWTVWALGFGFMVAVLVVTQSRGAAVGLLGAGLVFAVIHWRQHHPATRGPSHRTGLGRALAPATLILILAALLLWFTHGRQMVDWRELTSGGQGSELSYAGPISIRLNLHQVGFVAFTQAPLLGFGPGTSTTEFLVPAGIIPVGPHHVAHAPQISHLHSAALEVLARFGLAGALIGGLLAWVLGRAYRRLWSDPRAAPDLRLFLTLAGLLLVFFCLYDFRIMNLELRFFWILFFGILYSFQFGPATEDQTPGSTRG